MNRTVIILNLLVSSISLVPIDDKTTTLNEDEYSKAEDSSTTIISEETKDALPILMNKDDVLTVSDLNKIYNSVENVFSKTRYLRDQPENEQFEIPKLKTEVQIAKRSKSAENVDLKTEERSTTSAISEIESKDSTTEDSKSVDATSELNEFESTTISYRMEGKTSDYLEIGKVNNDPKVALDEELTSNRRSFEIPNDESNSEWDMLDDIAFTRRMFSYPDITNLDLKAKSGDEEVLHMQEKAVSTPNLELPRNDFIQFKTDNIDVERHGAPQIVAPSFGELLYFGGIPGLLTLRPANPVEFRRILIEETKKLFNRRFQNEVDERMESSHDSKAAGEYDDSNAYPYTPLESGETEQISNPYTLFDKLAQASEHAQRVKPKMNILNTNAQNAQISPVTAFSNIKPSYTVPVYKYVTGYGNFF